MKKISLFNILLFLIILLAVLFDIYLLVNKDDFHIDEIFSYGASNSDIGWRLFLGYDDLDNTIITGNYIKSYLFPLLGSFARTWNNSMLDNHPPFYFLLFRFFCLIFSGNLILPVIFLNILSLVGILIAFYKLSLLMFEDKEWAIVATGIFAFTSNLVSLVIFIRMYIVLMLFSLWFLYYTCKYVFENKYRNLILCFIFSILSFLTHYYSFIFVFWVTTSIGFVLILDRKYLKMLVFSSVILIGVLCSFCIYPNMINTTIESTRGLSFIEMIFSEFMNNSLLFLQEQAPLFYETMFGSLSLMVLFFVIFLIVVYWAIKKDVIKKREKLLLFLFFAVFCLYSILLTFIIPIMRPYQIRYFTPIVPVFVLINIYIMFLFFKIFNLKKFVMYLVFILNMIVCVYGIDKNPFYMPKDNTSIKLKNIIKNNDIWWGFGGASSWAWMLYMYMDKFIYADRIWSIDDFYNEDFINFSNNEVREGKYAYLFVYSWWEDKKMNIVENPIEVVKNSTNRQAYYLFTVNVMVFKADVYLICPY